ncbi:MAG: AAA family ATPase [Nocardioidaceae bacterium]|nr:AAA family ATPase [Nocardioidaceae bacterium]
MLVLVTGVPGSGKTTLARSVAAELELPMLSRDVIKETLFDTLGLGDKTWADTLGRASSSVLWALLANGIEHAVVDTWLDPSRDDADDARHHLAASICVVELLCECPGDLAASRYAQRVRHIGHGINEHLLQRIRASAPLMRPLGIGPTLRVDTSAPVDVAGVVSWVRDTVAAREET